MSNKDGVIELDGVVEELLPGSRFIIKVKFDMGDGEIAEELIEGHLGGKMRMHSIRVVKHDVVKVEIAPSDMTKCRIVYRYK